MAVPILVGTASQLLQVVSHGPDPHKNVYARSHFGISLARDVTLTHSVRLKPGVRLLSSPMRTAVKGYMYCGRLFVKNGCLNFRV